MDRKATQLGEGRGREVTGVAVGQDDVTRGRERRDLGIGTDDADLRTRPARPMRRSSRS
jgi:hypothetical protein